MKRFICALLACCITVSLIACSAESEDTTGIDSAADTWERQTEVVTDEEGNTTVIEVTKPAEDSTVSTDETSPSEDETGTADTEKNETADTGSDGTSGNKGDVTTYPIEKNPIDDLSGIELVNAAYNKMNALSSYEYITNNKMSYMNETAEYTFKTVLKEGSDGIQYASEMIYDGEIYDAIYHKDGYTYQTIDGELFKGKMTKDEFREYLFEIGASANEYVSAFTKIETKKTDDGAAVILSEFDISRADVFEGVESFEIETAEGSVVIDKEGYVVSEHISVSFKVGRSVIAEIIVDTEIKNVNSVTKVSFPALDGYRETDNLAGLYRLTSASEAYDIKMLEGMSFELSQDINVSGSKEKAHDIVEAECEYSYQESLLNTKILLDVYAKGSYNGEEQEMSIASDGKNVTMVYNGLESKTKYDEDLVWTLLSEMLEYTLGYASCIADFKEEKTNNGYLYTYTADEDYGYYFVEKAIACLETELDYDKISTVSFESIECSSEVDKYGELVSFSNRAVFSFTMTNGDVYNVNYNVGITVHA